MIKHYVLAGLTAALLAAAAATAQPTSGSTTPPTGPGTENSATAPPSAAASGSALPSSDHMSAPPNAAQHGADSAARTVDPSDAAAIDKCKVTPPAQRVNNSTCAKLMKEHPTLMNDASPQ